MLTSFNPIYSSAHIAHLQSGAVVVIPTDTIYGLACRADDSAAVARLYGLKDRHNKPGTIIASSADQLRSLGLSDDHVALAEKYWPGSVSVLIEAPGHLAYLTQGLPELACRVIDGPTELVDLLNTVGPLITTSANLPGEEPAKSIQEAEKYFTDKVDRYIDGGIISDNNPSTLIRITDKGIDVLRQGAVTIESNKEAQ